MTVPIEQVQKGDIFVVRPGENVPVDGIVLEAKGFWVIGLVKVILEAIKNIILNAQLESRLRNS